MCSLISHLLTCPFAKIVFLHLRLFLWLTLLYPSAFTASSREPSLTCVEWVWCCFCVSQDPVLSLNASLCKNHCITIVHVYPRGRVGTVLFPRLNAQGLSQCLLRGKYLLKIWGVNKMGSVVLFTRQAMAGSNATSSIPQITF